MPTPDRPPDIPPTEWTHLLRLAEAAETAPWTSIDVVIEAWRRGKTSR